MAQEIQNLEKSLISVKEFISKSYMQQFASANCSVAVIQNESKAKSKIRMLRIDQLVLSDERVEERMETIFQALNPLVKSCFLLYQGKNGKISLYIGFRSDVPSTAESTLIQVLKGNFPGIKYERLEANRIEQILGRLESTPDSLQTVASLSVVPSERRQDGEKSQGFEKFLNSMDGHDFSALILSTPYGDKEIQHRILALEQISTSLSSLESVTLQNTSSQSLTLTESAAQAVSASINESLSEAYTQGSSIGSFSSSGNGYGFGGANNFGAPTLSANRNYQTGFGQTQTSSSSLTDTRTYGTSIGKTTTNGLAFGITGGQSVALSRTQTNMEIQNLKKRIDDQIERLQKSQAQGLWNCQGYFVSERNDTVYAAANSFRSLVMGDQTNVDASEMVFWQPTPPQSRVSNHKNIQNLTHFLSTAAAPVFLLGNKTRTMDSLLTGNELAHMMSFPRKSSGEVAVIHQAEFGRAIRYRANNGPADSSEHCLKIGQIYHMGETDPLSPAFLEMQKLNTHLLAVGASGSGKTTAVLDLLLELQQKGIPFTVIEPAKGEYGSLFANMPDVEIFSTNPFRYRMLKINPFVFEEGVHILNHMELLISVFSTAWPLYAAQPALLRDCVRRAYIKYGWDLTNSICLRKEKRYPTFEDVLEQLPGVIARSHFVGESKGTYQGALQTRLSMLTEGIFKELFGCEEGIPDEVLFDHNTIIDLSPLGSPETLSLTMGILLIRLYEHRMNSHASSTLKHVTVLEEAHNILKASPSGVQSEDTASITSRSVEVLTKCITELRFTGEGFIIADQSPCELDKTAIKNSATKIVLRLQDLQDQQAAGSALGLNDEQVRELSRLEVGVGAVFQESWTEPVLVRFDHRPSPFAFRFESEKMARAVYDDVRLVRGFLLSQLIPVMEKTSMDFAELKASLKRIHHFSQWKLKDYQALIEFYERKYQSLQKEFSLSTRTRYSFLGQMVLDLLNADELFNILPLPEPDGAVQKDIDRDPRFSSACRQWKEEALEILDGYVSGLDEAQKKRILRLLLLADGEKNRLHVAVCAAAFS